MDSMDMGWVYIVRDTHHMLFYVEEIKLILNE